MKKALLLGPHPDDAFIGCSGFVIKNGSKFDIDVCCFATKNINPSEDTRKQEEISSWQTINKRVKVSFFDGEDTKLYNNQNEIIDHIESLVSRVKYDYVFTPYPEDTHQDHRTISEATMSACRYQKNILFYETPSTITFHPNLFVELKSTEAKQKMEISRMYESQILGSSQYEISLEEYIESKLLSNGATSRVCKHAEGFVVYKAVI